MRFLLRTLGLYFILVAMPRVAIFSNRFTVPGPEGWLFNPYDALGILFAIGLGLSIYTFSYFASLNAVKDDEWEDEIPPGDMTLQQRAAKRRRDRKLRDRETASKRALYAAYLFAAIDGLFNLAEVSSVAIISGAINDIFSPVGNDVISLIAVWVFALVPTFASFIAGWVTAAVDKIPEKPVSRTSVRGIIKTWVAGTQKIREITPKKLPETTKKLPETGKNGKNTSKYPAFLWTVGNGTRDETDIPGLAQKLGVSTRTVYRYFDKLEEERDGV